MKLTKTAIIISVTALVLSAVQYFKSDKQKTAYIYINEVVAEYHAMQDVDDKLTLSETMGKENLDTFYKNIQDKINWLKENHENIKDSEVVDKHHEIIDLEKVFNTMKQRTNNKLDSIRFTLKEPIYKDVNQYIKNYSEENGYDYVLGNLGNGNIMYGNNIYDITLEVIDGINVAYNKKRME